MKKGLTLTLMTVALAMLGLQAMAMAPVIGEIPSPVVGNAENATGPNQFVFPDAINLNSFATDDNITTSSDIIWSYTVAGDPIYNINGHGPIDVATESPNSPGAKQINKTVVGGELNPDGIPGTITIRNIKISPLGSTVADTVPAAGDAKAALQTVTLFASDGASYSSKEITCFTDIGGGDRMSPGVVPVKSYTGWTSTDKQGWVDAPGPGVTMSVSNGALCMDTPNRAGVFVASYSNKLGDMEILDGYVYHIRAKVTGSQATPGHTPFWDMTISNPAVASAAGDPVPFHGYNAYGVDAYFFDNQGTGGANAATTTPTDFHVWWAPSAIDTPQWKAAAFLPAAAAEMKSQVTFRVLDANNSPALLADNAWGSLCVSKFDIERYPLSNMQKVDSTPVYSVDHNFKDHNAAGTGTVLVAAVNGSKVDWTGGVLTITPQIKGTLQVELVNIYPSADLSIYDAGATGAGIADDFPIVWESDSLYQITVDMQAKDANGEANPFDAFFMNVNEPSNEVLYSSMLTTGGNMMGSPKVGAGPQTYMAFFYSHKATASTATNFKRWRPTLQFASNQLLTLGDASGALKISKFEVNKVKFQ